MLRKFNLSGHLLTQMLLNRVLLNRVLIAWMLLVLPAALSAASDREEFFETQIRPVLVARCFKCHGGENTSGELRVDTREALLRGGTRGPAIVPGAADASLLLKAIEYQDEDLQMPSDDRLNAETVAAFRAWIQDGATWPRTTAQQFTVKRHWAFAPVKRPQVPRIGGGLQRNAIDAFIQKRLQQSGLSASPAASRRVLVRRLFIDLTGLPPGIKDLEQWETDTAPDAIDRLIEQLLHSPAYGERWARHWLDVARYADTKGYVFREERKFPFSHTYRDWVIRALNEDRPYDDFLVQQIAADLNESASPADLAAMGFLTLGRRFLNNRHDIINDRIDVVTRGTMGLTVTCARCHDHKYDPIPTADYYSLYGVFASSRVPDKLPEAMVLQESGQPFNPRIFERGNPRSPGEPVPRQFLQVVAGPDRKPFEHGSGRLELARAIADRNNPLTARVWVNRLWKHHFHAPLVRTTSDFGLRSDPPEHPELLDFLASELIASGWSTRHIHRLILGSATYQQDSSSRPAAAAVDPENRLLWRMNRGRLDFETMRDSMLAVTGQLQRRMFGPSVDIVEAQDQSRRSVYAFIDRQNLPALFRTFDFASPDTHAPTRFQTTVPQQTLYLRNAELPMRLAEQLTRPIEQDRQEQPERQVSAVFRAVLARSPTEAELAMCRSFLHSETGRASVAETIWEYGYGQRPENSTSTVQFTPLPHWTGQRWQGGLELPDKRIGWTFLSATGGHPGDAAHCAILRFHCPVAGQLRLRGELKHPSDKGDGIEALAIRDSEEILGRWTARNGANPTSIGPISVEVGSTIDLLVASGPTASFDSFEWRPVVTIESGGSRHRFAAAESFHGPVPQRLSRLAQLAQTLLISNEFQFVD